MDGASAGRRVWLPWTTPEAGEASGPEAARPSAKADGDEQRLVDRLRSRDEAAFNELVSRYGDQVFHLVLRMLGDRGEAEDLSQEVFVTVFKSIDRFRGDAKLSTWLYRVATNHCKNRIKYWSRRARSALHPCRDEGAEPEAADARTVGAGAPLPRPDDMAEGREVEHVVQRALLELPEDQRELVVLRDIESLSYEDVQRVTGLAEGTVKSRLHRARLAIQQRVDAWKRGDP